MIRGGIPAELRSSRVILHDRGFDAETTAVVKGCGGERNHRAIGVEALVTGVINERGGCGH